MKFYLFGGSDAPDWILAEITTLSKLSSLQIKQLALHITHRILEGIFDYEKVRTLISDSSLEISDLKACIAVLHFFLTNAAKFDVNDSTLSRELQQLGLPKEHSDALCKPYHDSKEALQTRFLQQSLKLPEFSVGGWQTRVGVSKIAVLRLTAKQMDDDPSKGINDVLLCLTSEKLQILIHELKTARALMDEIS